MCYQYNFVTGALSSELVKQTVLPIVVTFCNLNLIFTKCFETRVASGETMYVTEIVHSYDATLSAFTLTLKDEKIRKEST